VEQPILEIDDSLICVQNRPGNIVFIRIQDTEGFLYLRHPDEVGIVRFNKSLDRAPELVIAVYPIAAMLAGQEECLEFDPAVFTAFVEKVVVSGTKKEVRLRFVLRDGSEYKIDGVR
jgi:hypothetical protein